MSKRRWMMPGLFAWAAVVLVVFVGLRADAGSQSAAAAPTSTAVVDIQRLINGLTEFKDAQTKLAGTAKEKQAEIKVMEDEAKALKADYDLIKDKTSQPARDLAIKINEKNQQIESRGKMASQDMEIRAGEAMYEIYQKVLVAVQKLSTEEGWELVLVDDRSIEWPKDRVKTNNRINDFITAKRILYAAERIDLTQRTMTRMNNAYAAGGKN
ncbi:MAG: OmpH family outer membrane protein [Phycisphaerales bacterium]